MLFFEAFQGIQELLPLFFEAFQRHLEVPPFLVKTLNNREKSRPLRFALIRQNRERSEGPGIVLMPSAAHGILQLVDFRPELGFQLRHRIGQGPFARSLERFDLSAEILQAPHLVAHSGEGGSHPRQPRHNG